MRFARTVILKPLSPIPVLSILLHCTVVRMETPVFVWRCSPTPVWVTPFWELQSVQIYGFSGSHATKKRPYQIPLTPSVIVDEVGDNVNVVVVASSHTLSQFLQPMLHRSSSQTHMLNDNCKRKLRWWLFCKCREYLIMWLSFINTIDIS